MAALVWDKVGERLYETGTKKGVLYPIDEKNTYSKGVAWNGLTAVTESPSGAEASPIYADDIKYLNLVGNEEFGGTIEAYMYPNEWMECDGSFAVDTEEAPKGLVFGQQTRKTFGLSFVTTLGNDTQNNEYGYKLHLIYGALASPSERAYATINDSPEAITFSWEFSTTPVEVTVEVGGKKLKPVSCLTINSKTANPEYLKKLEEVLYGTASKDARLPLPDEVIKILTDGEEATVD